MPIAVLKFGILFGVPFVFMGALMISIVARWNVEYLIRVKTHYWDKWQGGAS